MIELPAKNLTVPYTFCNQYLAHDNMNSFGGRRETGTSCTSGVVPYLGTFNSSTAPLVSKYASSFASSGIRVGSEISLVNSPQGQCSGDGSVSLNVLPFLTMNGGHAVLTNVIFIMV